MGAVYSKQNKRHDDWKIKRKNATDRMGAIYAKNKTRDMTDHIGVVYVGRQNKITQRIVWVSSTPNKTRDMTDRIGVIYA